jgi:hypothetical protein
MYAKHYDAIAEAELKAGQRRTVKEGKLRH